jgi:histidyl-tRNA synthetase
MIHFNLAQEIRNCGLNTTICYLSDTTFKSQFNFALNSGVKFVVIMGENEREKNLVQIKNLESREQEEVLQSEIEKYFSDFRN